MTIAAIEPDTGQLPHGLPPQKPASWGQFLLPLFFAAMETCWLAAIFIGLANTSALGTTHLLFPLWLPFVLIASFYLLSSYQQWYAMDGEHPLLEKGNHITFSRLANTVLTIIATLLAVWVSAYAPQTAITNPAWLLNIPAVILQFNSDSFRLIGLLVLAIAFCRQGTLLVRGKVNYVLISKLMQSGIFTFILLMVIQKFLEVIGHFYDDGWTILFLIVLYLCLSLATHALARVGVVRRHYAVERKKDLIRQERVTLQSVLLASCILLALALGIGAILNATIIRDTGVLFFKPNSFFIPPLGNAKKAPCDVKCTLPDTSQQVVHHGSQQPTNPLFSILLFALFIILLLAMITFILVLVIKFIRWWRKRERPRQRWELHESLWSWPLFLQQFKSILHALLKHVMTYLLRPTQHTKVSLSPDRQITSIHNIYEIYRSFLHYAAIQGYPRASYETPNEFSNRLTHQFPLIEPDLALITSAYITTRYAASTLKPEDVAATQSAWLAVQQNWQ